MISECFWTLRNDPLIKFRVLKYLQHTVDQQICNVDHLPMIDPVPSDHRRHATFGVSLVKPTINPHCVTRFTSCISAVRGFTLIELLVVISLIALLLSILLPAFQRSRGLAQDVQCMTNLRQYGAASLIYSNDHRNLPWYDKRDTIDPKWHSDAVPIVRSILLGTDVSSGDENWKHDDIGHCPQDENWLQRGEPTNSSYGINILTSPARRPNAEILRPLRIEEIANPSRKMLWTDTQGRLDDAVWQLRFFLVPGYPDNLNDLKIDARHNNRQSLNTVMIDGHVQQLPADFINVPGATFTYANLYAD